MAATSRGRAGRARHRIFHRQFRGREFAISDSDSTNEAIGIARPPSIGTFWAISVRLPDLQIIDFAHLGRRTPGAFDK